MRADYLKMRWMRSDRPRRRPCVEKTDKPKMGFRAAGSRNPGIEVRCSKPERSGNKTRMAGLIGGAVAIGSSRPFEPGAKVDKIGACQIPLEDRRAERAERPGGRVFFKRDAGSCRSEGEQDGEDQPCEADRPDDGVAAPGCPAGLHVVFLSDPLGHPALMPVTAPENKCPGGWRPLVRHLRGKRLSRRISGVSSPARRSGRSGCRGNRPALSLPAARNPCRAACPRPAGRGRRRCRRRW